VNELPIFTASLGIEKIWFTNCINLRKLWVKKCVKKELCYDDLILLWFVCFENLAEFVVYPGILKLRATCSNGRGGTGWSTGGMILLSA
jgi:hypothetical protein